MSVYVIAEIGSVHDGSFGNAKQAALLARECGANAVKYQVHIPEAETLKSAPSPSYFASETRWDYFKRTGFTQRQWQEIKVTCDDTGIEFLASPFSHTAVELLQDIGMRRWKIPSGEVTNLPMLQKIAALGDPVLLSSGMSTWEELNAALAALQSAQQKVPVTLLQCTSEYPCPHERVGLNVMEEMRERYGLPVGLSDHSADLFTPVVAVARGAVVIEKHLTFSRAMYGSDARHSLEPTEFKSMIEGIRCAEVILTNTVDKDLVARQFREMKHIFEKSIVARRNLQAGTCLTHDDIDFRKPGTGISAAQAESVVGRVLKRAVKAEELFCWSHFQ